MGTTHKPIMPAAYSPRGSKPALTLRQQALRALARREYSRAELARKLSRRGADAPAAGELDALLDEFEGSGWLSDARFAAGAARHRGGRYSQRYIVADLKSRGVDSDTAKDAVSALGQDDYAIAAGLWRQRFGAPPADAKEKARQIRFLQARGFAFSVVLRVLREQGVDPGDE